MREGKIVLKAIVSKIEGLKNNTQTYGNLTEVSLFRCAVSANAKSKIKIIGSELEKK